ncbi:MAG: aminoacyl-tRNA hydrolase [Pseudomonadota bacterium]
MKLFAGLGNPGARYARNRHNVGFMAVDAIADAYSFGPWRSKFSGQLSEGRLSGTKILLLKPDTYMNRSGDALQAAITFYKLNPADVIVFHDELDLAPGKIRVKQGGGHAGHNGLRSITAHLGAEFSRVRIGIGHPGDKALVSNYVLSDFAKADEAWLQPLLDATARSATLLASGDSPGFANAVARAMPQKKPTPTTKPAADTTPSAGTKTGTEPPTPRAPEPEGESDPKSLLQKLADKFR